MFEDMPVAAAVTLLTKLQSDVRYAEGEVLHTLVANIDMKDIRVNKLSAFVIPNAQTIVRGDKFSAQIVMAAVDTTQQPQIYIGGRQMNLRNNTYEIVTGRTGDFNLTGYITMRNGSGDVIRVISHRSTQWLTQRNGFCRPHECALCRLQQSYQHKHPGRSA